MRLLAVTLLLLLLPSTTVARDWKAFIQQLESQPQTVANRQQIAVCCNNLALEHMRSEEWNEAERWLKKAISLDKNPVYEEHLSKLYLQQALDAFKDRSSRNVGGQMHQRAKLLAKRSLAYNKKEVGAYMLIGRIEYDNQKLTAAKRAWKSAKKIDPNTQGVDEMLAKVDREMKVEQKFKKKSNSFFEVRYQKDVDAETAAGLKYAMDTAREVVGRDFMYRPKHKLVVLVYPTKAFSKLNLGPHWAVGLYDGKIRLPLDDQSNLTNAVCTLFHEYTHAVIHDLSNGYCPKWLNEGLADVQGSKISPRGTWMVKEGLQQNRLISLGDLSDAFQSTDDRTVSLGYQQAYTVATFMTEKYGARRVRRLIDETAKDVPWEIALRKTCGVTSDAFEAKWKEWLPSFLAKAKK